MPYRTFTTSATPAQSSDSQVQAPIHDASVQWIPPPLLRHLIAALFDHAIEHGTRSWDGTILEALYMLLYYHVRERIHDLPERQLQSSLASLNFRHVRLTLVKGRLRAEIRVCDAAPVW